MSEPNVQVTPLNDRVAQLFGTDASRRFDLVPDRDFIERCAARCVFGSAFQDRARDALHVWFVTRDRCIVDVKIGRGLHHSDVVAPVTFGHGDIVANRYVRRGVS